MRLRLKLCLIFILCSVLLHAQGTNSSRTRYINQFMHIAISEMDRSGIPASITLAQGLHESNAGGSKLAVGSNNHFGIKCKKEWRGKTYYHEDDDYDREGNLLESCFRAYIMPEDSYIDHTDFLMTRSHYAFIFQYPRTDYKNWAKGLKKAGYATDSKYADKIIAIIEQNDLAQYDYRTSQPVVYVPVVEPTTPTVSEPIASTTPPAVIEEQEIPEKEKAKIPEFHDINKPLNSLFPKRYKDDVFQVNQIKTTVARLDDVPLSVARRYDIPLKKILKYNDMHPRQNFLLEQYVFLQPKRTRWRGENQWHIVKEGETMYSISQLYGIRLKSLYKRNKMTEGQEPAVKQEIALRGKRQVSPKINTEKRNPERWHKDVPVSKTGTFKEKIKYSFKPIPDPDEEITTTNINTIVAPPVVSKPQPVERPVIDEPADEPVVINTASFGNPPITSTPSPFTNTDQPLASYINTPTQTSPPLYVDTVERTDGEEEKFEIPTTTMPDFEIVAVVVEAPPPPSIQKNKPVERPIPARPTIKRPDPVNRIETTRPVYSTSMLHEVVKGDTLWNIAQRYDTSVTSLRSLNSLTSNLIQVGSQLKVK